MKLSVLAAVDDHSLDPAAWFAALHNQTADPADYEVIAVDAHQMREWQEAYDAFATDSRHPRTVYRQVSHGGRARSLNYAIDESAGGILLFLADDFVPRADFVEQHLRFHEQHPERQAVGVGRALVPAELHRGPFAEWLERSGRFFGVPLDETSRSIPDYFFYIGNASVKRELVEAAGRFDEDFPYHCWDDFDYGLRLREAGMRSVLIPEATVVHEHPITLAERRQQMHESGQSAAIAERKDPGPHLWLREGDVPVWRWRAAAAKWRVLHLVTRRRRYRGLFYERTLTAAYAAGLRDGRGRAA